MPEILDIHIHRKAAGSTVPFDKIYLVHKEDRELISRIFGYSLVLPFNDKLISAISVLKPSYLTKKHFRRNDEDKNILQFSSKKAASEDVLAWWTNFLNQHDVVNRVVVVPVLTSTVRKHIRPRYLTAVKWQAKEKRNAKKTAELPQLISEYAYLATPLPAPNDKIRPLCNICPRLLLQMQGQCMPGEPICYKSLDFSEIDRSPDNASVQPDNG